MSEIAYGYAELVGAATVGLAQRPLDVTALAGPAGEHAGALPTDDPAGAVLAAAALLTAARRAGQLPAVLDATVEADVAPPDAVRELPPRAGAVLAAAVHLNNPLLTAQLLATTAAAGFRAPAPLLPALLNAAIRSEPLRPAVAAVLGERGRWLAAQRPAWHATAEQAALADPSHAGAPTEPRATDADGDDPWVTGTLAQRLGHLARLRERDPDAARELLAAGWTKENGTDREALLGVLAGGLGPADEAFLEAALDDRKAAVRDLARLLLARLPASAFVARAQARSAGLLRIARRGLKQRLTVDVPTDIAGAPRDGVTSKSPVPGVGPRVWLLMQLIAATPLATWVQRLGADPETLVRLPVADGYADNVHAGWRQAAVREGDARWAAALLAAEPPLDRPRPPAAWPPAGELVVLLPRQARIDRAIAVLGRGDPTAAAEAADTPGPWPPRLAEAALDHMTTAGRLPGDDLLLALALNAPPTAAYADRLRRLADAPPTPALRPHELRRTADLLELRRRFQEELP